MGASPAAEPERYREASPYELLPFGLPQYLVASTVLTEEAAERCRDRATSRDDKAEVLTIGNGGHFDIIAPGTKFWSRELILSASGTKASRPQTP